MGVRGMMVRMLNLVLFDSLTINNRASSSCVHYASTRVVPYSYGLKRSYRVPSMHHRRARFSNAMNTATRAFLIPRLRKASTGITIEGLE